jgi:hypothetical protein
LTYCYEYDITFYKLAGGHKTQGVLVMKKKNFVVGILALCLVFGMAIVGCDLFAPKVCDGPNPGKCGISKPLGGVYESCSSTSCKPGSCNCAK